MQYRLCQLLAQFWKMWQMLGLKYPIESDHYYIPIHHWIWQYRFRYIQKKIRLNSDSKNKGTFAGWGPRNVERDVLGVLGAAAVALRAGRG